METTCHEGITKKKKELSSNGIVIHTNFGLFDQVSRYV